MPLDDKRLEKENAEQIYISGVTLTVDDMNEMRERMNGPVVKRLRLIKVGLPAKSEATLGAGIAQAPQLEHIEISGRNLSDTGAREIASGLARNASVATLDLQNNNISDAGGEVLMAALGNHDMTKMATINLANNNIGNKTATALGNVLAKNKAPKWFPKANLFKPMAKLFGWNDTDIKIRNLNLSGNSSIDDKGGVSLISGLAQQAEALATLDLTNTNIGQKTVNSLLTSIKEGLTSPPKGLGGLEELNLGNSLRGGSKPFLEEKDIELLVTILKDPNCRLRKIDLTGWALPPNGYVAIASVLRTNKSLVELKLPGPIGKSIQEQFSDSLQTNTTLKKLEPFSNNVVVSHLKYNKQLATQQEEYNKALVALNSALMNKSINKDDIMLKAVAFKAALSTMMNFVNTHKSIVGESNPNDKVKKLKTQLQSDLDVLKRNFTSSGITNELYDPLVQGLQDIITPPPVQAKVAAIAPASPMLTRASSQPVTGQTAAIQPRADVVAPVTPTVSNAPPVQRVATGAYVVTAANTAQNPSTTPSAKKRTELSGEDLKKAIDNHAKAFIMSELRRHVTPPDLPENYNDLSKAEKQNIGLEQYAAFYGAMIKLYPGPYHTNHQAVLSDSNFQINNRAGLQKKLAALEILLTTAKFPEDKVAAEKLEKQLEILWPAKVPFNAANYKLLREKMSVALNDYNTELQQRLTAKQEAEKSVFSGFTRWFK